MSADLHTAPPSPSDEPTIGRRTHGRRAWFLLAVAAWNVWLWVTRAINLAQDPTPRTTGFIVVHSALYLVSFVLAVGVGVLGWRMLQEARRRPTSNP